ncbi:MAG: hypothetical protein ISS70_16680 [Phycisphaerae bacterium]|nr:hypothetical protein [Phycisphaerae bacterium]
MKTCAVVFCAIAVVAASGICAAIELDGDRGRDLNMIYPPDAFLEKGGPIVDVTKPPHNAKGSGDPADADHNTRASVAIYDLIGGVHTNHGRPLWYTAAYPYIQTNGAEVSIITRFMQGERTYETYVQDDREGKVKTFPSSDFPEIGTGKATERIVPLYIGYRGRKE